MQRTPWTVTALVAAAACAACAAPEGPSAPSSAARPPATAAPATAAPSAARYPADVLDLRDWYLTLPTGVEGDPDDVYQPELATFSGAQFRLNEARDGVVFTANAGGVTTEGSTYPRSELREMDGPAKASWSNTAGTHTLRVRQAVTAVPPVKPDVVTAQIHDAEDDVIEVRLEGEHLTVQYDDGDGEVTLDPAYALGTAYDLEIMAADGRVQVAYNGAVLADIPKSGSGWYFKSGSYVQSNPVRGDDPGAVGEVVLYALEVAHAP